MYKVPKQEKESAAMQVGSTMLQAVADVAATRGEMPSVSEMKQALQHIHLSGKGGLDLQCCSSRDRTITAEDWCEFCHSPPSMAYAATVSDPCWMRCHAWQNWFRASKKSIGQWATLRLVRLLLDSSERFQ